MASNNASVKKAKVLFLAICDHDSECAGNAVFESGFVLVVEENSREKGRTEQQVNFAPCDTPNAQIFEVPV